MTATATASRSDLYATTTIREMLRTGAQPAAIAAALEAHDLAFFKKPGIVKVVAAALFAVLQDANQVRSILESWYESWVLDRALRV